MMRLRCGFSFVELLVTMIFIGLLASIVVPRYSEMKLRARGPPFPRTLRFAMRYNRREAIKLGAASGAARLLRRRRMADHVDGLPQG